MGSAMRLEDISVEKIKRIICSQLENRDGCRVPNKTAVVYYFLRCSCFCEPNSVWIRCGSIKANWQNMCVVLVTVT